MGRDPDTPRGKGQEKNVFREIIPEDDHEKKLKEFFGGIDFSGVEKINDLNKLTILCFTNRCGSTYICSLFSELGLAGSPRDKNYEFLNYDNVIRNCIRAKTPSIGVYLANVSHSLKSQRNSFTFKAAPSQLNMLIENGFFRKVGMTPHIVIVKRRNVIAQAISLRTAMNDGLWTSLNQKIDRPADPIGPKVALIAARAVCVQNSLFDLMFEYHGLQPLTIYYEDAIADLDGTLDKISKFYDMKLERNLPNLFPIERQLTPEKKALEREIRVAGRAQFS